MSITRPEKDVPKNKCTYRSTSCEGRNLASYEAKLKSVVDWEGLCCQECLISMKKLIYLNNFGIAKYRKFGSNWQQYGTDF